LIRLEGAGFMIQRAHSLNEKREKEERDCLNRRKMRIPFSRNVQKGITTS